MNKKILSVMLLAAVLIFVGGQEKVSAYDVYCGTFRDGNKAYLMTETIRYGETNYDGWLTCRVKAVKNNSVTAYIDYSFDISEGGTVGFSNSQGFSGRFGGMYSRHGSPYPVASEIFETAYRLR